MSKTSVTSRQPQADTHSGYRRLDHLSNIQEGIGFTAVPDVLMDALLNNEISISKFKLICCMLRHSSKFKIKRSYLSARFSDKTLQKYLPEIEADGFVRREKIALQTGGYEVAYHTNRVEYWNLSSDPSLRKPSLGKPSLRRGVKETKIKKTKEKKNNNLMDGCKSKENAKFQTPAESPQHPASHKIDVIDLAKRFESHFTQNGFVNFRENNEWFNARVEALGSKRVLEFVKWFETTHDRHRYLWSLRNRDLVFEKWWDSQAPKN